MAAKAGDMVKIHYTGRFDDGTVFDTSKEREPLSFTLGRREVIDGFEEAVNGMSVGEKKTVSISTTKAYGLRREDLVFSLKKDLFPPKITPELGLTLQMRQPDGGIIDVTITEITDEMITLDANHPLAGKTLNFELEVMEIKNP